MKKKPWKTIVFLLIWTLILGTVYWSFSETPYTVFASSVYAIAGAVLFIFFLLVNGGFRSLPGTEEYLAQKHQEEEKEDKRKRSSKKNDKPEKIEIEPRPDLFHLGKEKQEKAARILLMLAAPIFFVLAVDYLYLHFFYKG